MDIPLTVKLFTLSMVVLLVDVGIAVTTESQAAAAAGWLLIFLTAVLGLIAIIDVIIRVGRGLMERRSEFIRV